MSERKTPRRANTSRSVVWFVVLTALGGAIVFGAVRESSDQRFALVRPIVTGNRVTSSAAIVSAAAFTQGSNIWLLDTLSAERRVQALPWIQNAWVHRSWPNGMRIDVTERTPVARIFVPATGDAEEPADGMALVDQSLRVLEISSTVDGRIADRTLPLFRIEPAPLVEAGDVPAGGDVQTAYDVFLQLRGLGLRISEVDLSPATGVSVVCDDGLRVLLGSEEALADKVALLHAIASKIAQPEDVVYVDLRSVRAPTVLYR